MRQYEYQVVSVEGDGEVRYVNGVAPERSTHIHEYLNQANRWDVVGFSDLNFILRRSVKTEDENVYNYAHLAIGAPMRFKSTDPGTCEMVIGLMQQLELGCKVKIVIPSMVVEFDKLAGDKLLLAEMMIVRELLRQEWEPFSAFGSGDLHLRRRLTSIT